MVVCEKHPNERKTGVNEDEGVHNPEVENRESVNPFKIEFMIVESMSGIIPCPLSITLILPWARSTKHSIDEQFAAAAK
jgi:hypothetical protein